MTLAVGARLGPYEILAPLGAGGMGEVYRARDPRLAREVAIKVLPASFSADTDRLRRFEQEAKAAGILNHPNITAVYDTGSHDGAPYVVQELLEGETLRSILSGGKLNPQRAIEYSAQIARGLAAAHEKGIVHRDLKPENLFVTKDGRVKIMDFGLAKLTRPESGAGPLTEVPTATAGTEPGVVLGTVGYMSPEQVRGQPADVRSDIFTLGTILYEMLSGNRPFQGVSTADTMAAILKEDPPSLTATNQSLSPALDRIIRHCLEKSPERRVHSAHDLAFELESLTLPSGPQAPVRPRRSGSLRRAVVATGAVALAAAAFFAGRSGGPSESNASPWTYGRLTNMAGSQGSPALSPDGRTLAFVSRTAGKLDIWIQRAGGEKPIDLTPECDKDSYSPAFSPDGNLIAFGSQCAGGGLFLMGATGENARRLTTFGSDPAWSPDASEIVFTTEAGWVPYGRIGRSEAWVVDVRTGKTRKLFEGDAVQASVSPHKLRIAYWGLAIPGSQRDIWTIPYAGPASGEKPVPVTQDPALDWNPAWSPDGRFLYFLSNRDGAMNVWRVRIDESTGRTLSPPEPQTVPARGVAGLALARDGRHMAYVADEPTFSISRIAFDPSAGEIRDQPVEILHTSQEVSDITLSPDGQFLAFDSLGGTQEDIFLIRTDGSGLRKLTDDAPRDRFPSFSGDGSHIAFMSDRSGVWELWTIQPDGSGLSQLTQTNESPYTPLWSPTSDLIVASTGTDLLLFGLNRSGGAAKTTRLPRPVGGLAAQAIAWGPDGSRILVTLNQPDGTFSDVAYFSLANQTFDVVPRPPHLPPRRGRPLPACFVPGNRLLLVNADGLYLSDSAASGGRLLLPHPPAGRYFGMTLARDGRTLYLLRLYESANIWQATLP